ncbi:HlyC/CorC family transporter [Thermodesulfobacterium sp. TA1]|uniref:hemolysin family protein n=1 Tax=Thermodesulfobacterium sp. TA1 TaxID=2234087 RepID=UPI001232DCD8|nr:hemolysin family protein [Thermodesulfobacterium sp. TA1]QER42019.1 HlyC/CorC family transporter [Thermodesulfobacterium sp. TA1]
MIGFISFLFFVLGEAFFACSEMAFISVERYLMEKLDYKKKVTQIYFKLWENPERLFTTTLLGITLCVVGNGIFTPYFLIRDFGIKGLVISSTLVPIAMVVLGQVIPKTIGKKFAYPLILYLLPLIYYISFIFWPLVYVNTILAQKLLKPQEKNPIFLSKFREIFLTFIRYEEEIDRTEKELMHKIIDFAKKKVSQVMIPISQVKALPLDATVKDAIEFSKKYNFSYIPLYENDVSHLKAIVKVQHLIGKTLLEPNKPLKNFIQTPIFFPEMAHAHDVLSALQKSGMELAIIVDEYGFTTGIVTIEDLIEEVLGEFRDALDYYVPEYQKISENVYRVTGFIEIEKLQQIGLPIPSGDYETLNGFIYSITGKIPGEGEVIYYKNLEMKILKATPQTVEEVMIKIKPN